MKPKDERAPLVMDQQAAARALAVSTATLRRWAREGKGPAVLNIGRMVRYRPEDLDRFLSSSPNGQATHGA
jgi:excisionase family DNA binding protein